MNQTLTLSRLSLLFKLHFTENGRSYLMSIALCIGGMLVLMTPLLFTSGYNDLLYVLHISALFGIIIGSSLMSSTSFDAYNHAAQGIPAIMLPASRLEKFLVLWLSHLLFIVLAFSLFLLIHYWIIDTANLHIPATNRRYFSLPDDIIRFFGFAYFITQGACFLGSLYYKKNAFLKSLGLLTGVVLIAFCFNLFLAYQLTGNPSQVTTFPFIFWEVIQDRRYVVDFPAYAQKLIYAFLSFLVVAFWATTYVRLKEKEI